MNVSASSPETATLEYQTHLASPRLAIKHPFVPQSGDWKYCLALVLLLSFVYLLIENGRWHPGADTAFYISIARSLAEGNGFRFNGVPVGKIPPLWPLLLAGAMKISTSLWFLNLIPATCLVAACACWYYIARRFLPPAKAFATAFLSGTLFFWYTSAIQLRTEALFCLLFAAAVLLALQVGEGRWQWVRIGSVCALCALAVGARWVGLVCWLPVALAMLHGQLKPKFDRRWIGAVLVAVISLSSFYGCRQLLRWLPGKQIRIHNTAAEDFTPIDSEAGEESDGALSDEDMDAPVTPAMQSVFVQPGVARTVQRFANAGKWLSSLLWMPMYLGVTSTAAGLISNPIGWGLIVLFLICLWSHLRKRQWLLLGVLLYCGALVFRWRYPNPRYLVPVAPLLLLGVWSGMQILAEACKTPFWRRTWTLVATLFIASLVVCNAALWAVEVYIARADDFYGHYMAGDNDKLIAAAKYLNDRGIKHGQVAVSYHYLNLGRLRRNGQGLRSMHLLTNRLIRSVPRRYCTDPPLQNKQDLLTWAANRKVRYYLYRPPVSPWRAHHFRIGWWQKFRTGQAEIPVNPSWILFEIDRHGIHQVELPNITDWPSHVPGF